MPHGTLRNLVAATVLTTLMLSGCYAYEDPPAQATAPPAPPAPPVAGPSSSTGSSSARPSRAGAKQAAQNTVDKIGERQKELEKALEDPG